MSMLNVFKAHLPSVNYIFRNGKPAIFVQGRYCTEVIDEIKELQDEVSKGHPHIYIDQAEVEVDSTLVDPVQVLREKIRAQILAEMAAATDPTNDMGSSTQTALKPASSADIAMAASGGSGAPLAAKLMNLTSSKAGN